MRAQRIVKADPVFDDLRRMKAIVLLREIDRLLFQRPPEPFDKDFFSAHPWRFSLPPRAILAAGVLLNVSQKHAGAVKSGGSAMPGPELPGPELSVCEIAGTLKPVQDTAAQGDI